MSDRFESEAMEDMLSEVAEGPAQSAFDAGENLDEGWDAGEDEGDDFLEGVMGGRPGGVQAADEFEEAGFEGFEGFEEFEAAPGGDAADTFEDAVADALEEEDTDEFMRTLRRLARGAARTAGQVGRGVGRVARVAAPILKRIPLPQAQAIGQIASVAGRLLADGADEFEAIDELVETYDDEAIDAAAPLIAGMTIRRLIPQVARLPQQARRQLVRNVSKATRTLVRKQGAPAARATARIVQRAQRAVRERQIPARALPQAVRKVAQRVAETPRAVKQLARPLAGRAGAGRGGYAYPAANTRRLVLRGPATITITIRR